jgi:hypothetical protein
MGLPVDEAVNSDCADLQLNQLVVRCRRCELNLCMGDLDPLFQADAAEREPNLLMVLVRVLPKGHLNVAGSCVHAPVVEQLNVVNAIADGDLHTLQHFRLAAHPDVRAAKVDGIVRVVAAVSSFAIHDVGRMLLRNESGGGGNEQPAIQLAQQTHRERKQHARQPHQGKVV